MPLNATSCSSCSGFVEEMRFVAMKLHTKGQSPKEGGKEAAPQPFQKVLSLLLLEEHHEP